MRALMATPPMTPQPMPGPTLYSRPGDRDHEHDERERDGDPGNVEEIAKSVVRVGNSVVCGCWANATSTKPPARVSVRTCFRNLV
jgi:hypothetical protein